MKTKLDKREEEVLNSLTDTFSEFGIIGFLKLLDIALLEHINRLNKIKMPGYAREYLLLKEYLNNYW